MIFQDRLRKTGRVPRVEQSIVAQRRVVSQALTTKGTGGLEPPWDLRLAGEAHLTCVHATALDLCLDTPWGYFVISSRVSRSGGLWLKRKGALLSLSRNPPHTWENTPIGNSCSDIGAMGFVETPDPPPGFLCTNISQESR